MKAVIPTALPDILSFRKRTGADRWDEMWEGVLQEVWILDRDSKVAMIYVLKNGHYEMRAPEENGWIRSEAAGIELRSMKPGKLTIRLQNEESSQVDIPCN